MFSMFISEGYNKIDSHNVKLTPWHYLAKLIDVILASVDTNKLENTRDFEIGEVHPLDIGIR